MGVSWAILENLCPNYPLSTNQPHSLANYMIATTMDIPDLETVMVESPATEGPFGAKGSGEMTGNPPSPAIVNVLHDAIGLWITDLPITPKKGAPWRRKKQPRNVDSAPEESMRRRREGRCLRQRKNRGRLLRFPALMLQGRQSCLDFLRRRR